jgi:hypothetical protein
MLLCMHICAVLFHHATLHCKKSLAIFLSPAGMSLSPARKSLVSDIPAMDRKIASLFYSVQPPKIVFFTLKQSCGSESGSRSVWIRICFGQLDRIRIYISGCSLLSAGRFYGSLNVLYGGLGIKISRHF